MRGKGIFYKVRFIYCNLMALFLNRLVCRGRIPLSIQKVYYLGKGKCYIGDNCILGYKIGGYYRGAGIELQTRKIEATIVIGNNVAINNNFFVCAINSIQIGNNVRIGFNVCIMDHEAHNTNPLLRSRLGHIGSVGIGDNVWIGSNVTILKETYIGKNSIVATGAVVSGSFPENVIIGGIPARIIKRIDEGCI